MSISAPVQTPPEGQSSGGTARTMLSRAMRFLAGPHVSIVLVLLGVTAVFTLLDPTAFLTVTNIRNITMAVSVLLVLAVGGTLVTITAGLDLSVGAVLVFSGVVAAKVMDAVGGGGLGTILAGLGVALVAGIAWGGLNGLLVTKAGLNPLIATLGTMGMAIGLAQVLTSGIDMSPPRQLAEFGTGRFFGQIPYLVVIAAAVALLGGIILSMTRFGRYTYAIGSSHEAARRAGISVDRHLIKVYTFAGCLSGLGGFLSLARFSSTTISGHTNDTLQVVAGIVIGGTSLFGGVGTVFGTAIGILIPGVLANGFVVVGTQPFWQEVAVGAVLIVAVYLDQLRRGRGYFGR